MHTFLIKQNSCLTKQEFSDLTNLAIVCRQFDETDPKIYWDIVRNQREIMGNFFCYQENLLIGYLSFFLFDENAVHISCMVHPNFRRQKVFHQLLQTACLEIRKLGMNKLVFPFPHKNESARKCLISLSGNLQFIEYQMERSGSFLEIVEEDKLFLKQANKDDVKSLATIDSICFESNYSVMLDRFNDTILDTDRQIWIAYLENDYIGKCHVQFDQHGAFIHDICILPPYQKNGYGTYLLKLVINHLININDCHQMYLEVSTFNESALNLYKKCHFNITNIYEYWHVIID